MLIITRIIASIGLNKIISISVVILNVAYPVTIVIMLLNLMKPIIKDDLIFKFCTYLTLVISLLDVIPNTNKFINYIPLNIQEFG